MTRSGVRSSHLHITIGAQWTVRVCPESEGGMVFKRIAGRWRARRDPQARQARKAQRRRERGEAFSEAEARSRRHGPSPTEVYTRGFRDPKR